MITIRNRILAIDYWIFFISCVLFLVPFITNANMLPDRDKDGVPDYDEINVYFTDPDSRDTDGDGYSDFVELNFGFSPFVPFLTLKGSDFDKDGLIDPIIIYGTSGNNGTEDGRIKILIYYKGKKHAIRHQNGSLDFERNTQVDADFYNLPISIQKHVRKVMKKMTDNNHAIFPYGWEENMDAKKTYFDEN